MSAEQVLPYALPFVIGLLTWLMNAQVNKRSDINARLDSQRADFDAILNPVRDDLAEYRKMYNALHIEHSNVLKRLNDIEDKLDDERRDKQLLVRQVGVLTDHIDKHVPGKPVDLHPRVEQLISRARMNTEGTTTDG